MVYFSQDQKYCGSLTKANPTKCDGETQCFCKGDYCLAGGGCFYGDVFVRGKPIGNTDWDTLDEAVLCQQIGFWKPKTSYSKQQ